MPDTRFMILEENPQSLFAAAKDHAAFKNHCGKSLCRYALRGILIMGVRVKLDTLRVGGRLMTFQGALTRFLEAMNQPASEDVAAPRSPSARNRAWRFLSDESAHAHAATDRGP